MKFISYSFAVLALLKSNEAKKLSYRPPKGSTPWHEENFPLNKVLEPDFPHGYKVPNFGAKDHDIELTHKHIKESEIQHGATLKAKFYRPVVIPDLRRPDFGKYDADIQTTINNEKLAKD